jgi:hypothetical protein
MRFLVEVSQGWKAKVSEIMAKFRKVFLAQHLRFSLIRTPSHAGDFTTFALCSPAGYQSTSPYTLSASISTFASEPLLIDMSC